MSNNCSPTSGSNFYWEGWDSVNPNLSEKERILLSSSIASTEEVPEKHLTLDPASGSESDKKIAENGVKEKVIINALYDFFGRKIAWIQGTEGNRTWASYKDWLFGQGTDNRTDLQNRTWSSFGAWCLGRGTDNRTGLKNEPWDISLGSDKFIDANLASKEPSKPALENQSTSYSSRSELIEKANKQERNRVNNLKAAMDAKRKADESFATKGGKYVSRASSHYCASQKNELAVEALKKAIAAQHQGKTAIAEKYYQEAIEHEDAAELMLQTTREDSITSETSDDTDSLSSEEILSDIISRDSGSSSSFGDSDIHYRLSGSLSEGSDYFDDRENGTKKGSGYKS